MDYSASSVTSVSSAIPSGNASIFRTKDIQKTLGKYYTPNHLTEILAEWAVRLPTDTVLEPSFGRCGFIAATMQRLHTLGATHPVNNVFGCDIDSEAFDHVMKTIDRQSARKNFYQRDFLTTNASTWSGRKFSAVIGNPPYVSHHNMDRQQKARARSLKVVANAKLAGNASLWAYFVLHSMSFLKDQGRLSFVLPQAFLTSQYSQIIRAQLQRHFRTTTVVKTTFRLFEHLGTSEKTVCLFANHYSKKDIEGNFFLDAANSIDELKKIVSFLNCATQFAPLTGTRRLGENIISPGKWEKQLINQKAQTGSDLFKVSIGLVTGANKYFIIDHDTVSEWALPDCVLFPILARTSIARGLQFSKSDFQTAILSNRRCWLFKPPSLGERAGPVRNYLATIPREVRKRTLWFTKRPHWYSPSDYRCPDAFVTYMNHFGPRVILNAVGADCTNTLHRIQFNRSIDLHSQKLIAISLQSSFSQISAERVGRAYGGGVLKLEPSELRKVKFILPKLVQHRRISTAFSQIDTALRADGVDNARSIADQFILGSILDQHSMREALVEFSSTLQGLRNQRCA